jgi:hypothetical protein
MVKRKRIWLLKQTLMPSSSYWKCFIFLFLLDVCQGSATEYQPWLGNFYEFELRSDAMYQGYAWLSSGSHLKKYLSNDVFLDFSLSIARPDPDVSLEFEIIEARTRRQRGDIDQLKLTGRYVWQDDIAGDPMSLITGISYIQAFSSSLKDVSSFHHGLYNAEFFLSLGKEWAEGNLWNSRWWSVFAIGIAERGTPWLRFRLDYDKRWGEQHETKLFLHSLWGLGRHPLRFYHFYGYGSIQHQSIDLGLRYTYLLEFYGSASLEYSYRVYAYNFPAYTHHVIAQLLYTFGL